MEYTVSHRSCLLTGACTTMAAAAALWWMKPEWTTDKVRAAEVGAAFISGSLLLYVWLFLPERQTRRIRSLRMGIFLGAASLLLPMAMEHLGHHSWLLIALILVIGHLSDQRSARWDSILE